MQSPRHHKRVASEEEVATSEGSTSSKAVDPEVAALAGQAAAVARIMIGNGLDPEKAAKSVALRVSAGSDLNEEQRADLERLLMQKLQP